MEIHVHVRAVFLELCPHPSIMCTHDNLESIFIFIPPPHTRCSLPWNGRSCYGYCLWVTWRLGTDLPANAAQWEDTENRQGGMDEWTCGRRCKKTIFFCCCCCLCFPPWDCCRVSRTEKDAGSGCSALEVDSLIQQMHQQTIQTGSQTTWDIHTAAKPFPSTLRANHLCPRVRGGESGESC